MGDTSIITQVNKEECQHLNSNGNHSPALNEKDNHSTSKKNRQNRGVLSSLFCCFGGVKRGGKPLQTSGETTIIQTSATDNTAAVLAHPNHNQNTLTKGYEDDEKEETVDSNATTTFESFYLLPALCHQDINKKCVVIDLDETLVHSSFKPVDNADFIVPVEIDGTVHQVYVLKRPYVDEFLKRMGELFECVLFTASLAKYADPVADLLDKTQCFRSRLFRESCVFYKGNYVKDLSKLGRDLHNVVILDNSPASYIFHPENAIPCTSWFDDKDDTELLDLIPFLENISSADNCITALQNNYVKYKAGQKFAPYDSMQQQQQQEE